MAYINNNVAVSESIPVNYIQINKDGTCSYFGNIAAKWINNADCQDELKELAALKKWSKNRFFSYELVDNKPACIAAQSSDKNIDSYLNKDRIKVIIEA